MVTFKKAENPEVYKPLFTLSSNEVPLRGPTYGDKVCDDGFEGEKRLEGRLGTDGLSVGAKSMVMVAREMEDGFVSECQWSHPKAKLFRYAEVTYSENGQTYSLWAKQEINPIKIDGNIKLEIQRPAGAGRLEMFGGEEYKDVMDPTPLIRTVKVGDFNGDGLQDIGILLSNGALEIYLQEQVQKENPVFVHLEP